MVGFPPQKQLRLQVVHLDGDSQYYPGFRVNGRPLARADLVTSGAYLRSAWGITNLVCEWLQTLARVPGHVRDAGRSRDVGPPASATKLSRRAALSACLLQPQVKLQRVIGAACAAGSAPEPLLVPCWRQLARPDSWGSGLRRTRYKPQRSFMRPCGMSSFELAARVRCVWLLSSPLGRHGLNNET